MSHYRFSMKAGKPGASLATYKYIARLGRYASSTDKEDLVCYGTVNLPTWATSPSHFWALEQKKKDGFKKIELSLPNELDVEQQQELLTSYLNEQFGNEYVYSFAIHHNIGRISGELNSHAHVIFSTRQIDHKREVSKEDWFKRGGKKKDGTLTGGHRKNSEFDSKPRKQQKAWIEQAREDWATIQNDRLKKNGIDLILDHRTLAAQGIEREPTEHIGPIGMAKKDLSYCKNMANIQEKEYQKMINEHIEVDAAISWTNSRLKTINNEHKEQIDRISEINETIQANQQLIADLKIDNVKAKNQINNAEEELKTLHSQLTLEEHKDKEEKEEFVREVIKKVNCIEIGYTYSSDIQWYEYIEDHMNAIESFIDCEDLDDKYYNLICYSELDEIVNSYAAEFGINDVTNYNEWLNVERQQINEISNTGLWDYTLEQLEELNDLTEELENNLDAIDKELRKDIDYMEFSQEKLKAWNKKEERWFPVKYICNQVQRKIEPIKVKCIEWINHFKRNDQLTLEEHSNDRSGGFSL